MTALTSITESLGHIATPLKGAGSWVREDGSPADMRRADHYPIFAACRACQGPIWLASQLQMEWWHVAAKGAAHAPPGGDTA
jgi:hypothetical protein